LKKINKRGKGVPNSPRGRGGPFGEEGAGKKKGVGGRSEIKLATVTKSREIPEPWIRGTFRGMLIKDKKNRGAKFEGGKKRWHLTKIQKDEGSAKNLNPEGRNFAIQILGEKT